MGGKNALPALLGEAPLPDNWDVLPYDAMPVKEFLAGVDFFVYFDSDTIVEAFGRSILEAVASGVVVILPERYREVFGEAAVYCAPEAVESTVREYHADARKYVAQSARAREEIMSRFSHAAYSSRILSQLGRSDA